MASDDGTTLQPSKLGTKDHWDDVYSTELANFQELGDEGEVWFGEESVEKMVDWSLENMPPSEQPAILEIGSGNGSLLFALQEAGYSAERMCGLDYSPDAVKLAQAVGKSRGNGAEEITFITCDFLAQDLEIPKWVVSDTAGEWEGWDLALDKGTFDAIALGERDENGRTPVAAYPSRLARLLRPGGYFLVTSCNFTEEELKHQFAISETGLTYHSHIQHRTFTFGGQKGNVVSSVAFQKSLPSPSNAALLRHGVWVEDVLEHITQVSELKGPAFIGLHRDPTILVDRFIESSPPNQV